MEAYGAIDPQASQETSLTNEEAQAVIGLWSLQRRLNDDALSKPTVSDIAESLNIPPDEVRKYLELARANQKAGLRMPRSLKADLALAFSALAVLALIAFCISAAFISTRNRRYVTPAYTASFSSDRAAPTPFGAEVPRSALIGYSSSPKRLVIGVGENLITPRYNYGEAPGADEVRKYLESAVAGPLADSSLLTGGSVSNGQIENTFAIGPIANSRFLQWKKVQVAYAGKVVEAQFPFARIADKNLRNAVAAKQSRLIESLVENVVALIGK